MAFPLQTIVISPLEGIPQLLVLERGRDETTSHWALLLTLRCPPSHVPLPPSDLSEAKLLVSC